MGQYTEGQRLLGSDGKTYVVRNGVPVTEGASPLIPNQKLPGELAGQSLQNTRTQQEIAAANATAGSTARKSAADAAKAELDLKTQQEAYDAAHPKGLNSTVVGPDFLKTLPLPDREIVQALGEGRLGFPGGFALKAPWWQQKLEQVGQAYPGFDATNFNTRAKARASLIANKLGTSANSLNTAIGHVGLINDQIPGTASHSFTPLNALENSVAETLGSPGITNYKDTAGKLASEETSVYRNGGGAEADVNRYLKSFNPNAAEAQKRGVVQNTLDLFASKQAANLYQYNLSSGGKPSVDLLDPAARKVLDQFPDIRDKYFDKPAAPLSPQAAALLQSNGGTPPSAPPPGASPQGGPPTIGGGPDYSGMVGGPQATAATGAYRNEFDPVAASALSALIRKGAPYETAAAYAQSHGFNPPDPKSYQAAVAFAASPAHRGETNVEANRSVPTSAFQRFAASPLAAGIAGSSAGATAGLSDVAGRALAGPQWDANRQVMSALNPGADLAGNVAGGVLGTVAGGAALGKIAPGIVDTARASRVAPFLRAGGDTAYGATYGASENPNDPLGGAITGGATGLAGGMFARGATKAVSRTIAPVAGAASPLYEAGVYPSLGQRAGMATGVPGILGKGINVAEQAMQSEPFLGALPAMSRNQARTQFQVGGFNNALGEIGNKLPNGVGPGTAAHSYTSDAFDKAYNTARSGMQFVPDNEFGVDLAGFNGTLNDGTLNAEQKAQVQQRIKTAVDSRLQHSDVMGGDAYKNAASELAKTQRDWAKTDPLKANALGDYMSIFDNAARRNSDPQAVAMLDQADRGYAQLVRIQRASEAGGAAKDAGTFTPTTYAGAVKQMGGGVRSSAYNRGEALGQDYAQAGLGLRDVLPDSGTPTRLMMGQTAMGVGGPALGLGGVMTNPVTLGMFGAYAPGVQNVIKHAIAPNEYRLPAGLANSLDAIGNGLYDRSGAIGRIGAPFALGYYGQQ